MNCLRVVFPDKRVDIGDSRVDLSYCSTSLTRRIAIENRGFLLAKMWFSEANYFWGKDALHGGGSALEIV